MFKRIAITLLAASATAYGNKFKSKNIYWLNWDLQIENSVTLL